MGKFSVRYRLFAVAMGAVALLACNRQSPIQQSPILLGATTTLEDSGILTELIDAFEDQHGVTIKPVIAGSGQIHQLIARGDIHTAITHDPMGEKRLLEDNVIRARDPLMRNDFLIIGPINDPAGVKRSRTTAEAFARIIQSGQTLVSRHDHSGTHQMERHWLAKASVTATPRLIKTGSGMGASLAVAVEREAYILVDRGTWLNFFEQPRFANQPTLTALFEHPASLPNNYSILSFGDNRADTWEQWLQSPPARNIILNYRINNQPLFFNQKNQSPTNPTPITK